MSLAYRCDSCRVLFDRPLQGGLRIADVADPQIVTRKPVNVELSSVTDQGTRCAIHLCPQCLFDFAAEMRRLHVDVRTAQ